MLKHIVIIFLIAPWFAQAHGLATSQSQTVGEYKIEFEYNTIGDVVAGEYTLYHVYLLDQSESGADFDSTFIRIEKQNSSAVLAGSLAPSEDKKGYASLSGIIQDTGTYIADVSFYKSGKLLAETKFNFNVESSSEQGQIKNKFPKEILFLLFLTGLLVGTSISWLIRK
jgi:hypothetical protein